MTQTLTREKLKALSPCSNKYLAMFGEHESMNIEQAFDAGFTVSDICWLMGALGKRKEIVEFANFCAKQAAAHAAAYCAAADAADWAAKAAYCAAGAVAYVTSYAAGAAANAADWAANTDGAAIRKEQKQFLMEILK